MSKEKNSKKWWQLSLGTMIIIGAVLGVLTGLFFGESCKSLSVYGQAFIGLLQMCVLPYILLSLIHGIGSLQYSQARQLALKGGFTLVIFWITAFIYIYLMSLCFPDWTTSSFFSSGMIAPPTEINYMEIYIPSNPFSSLSKNMVPAVTLFGICTGVALISIDEKGYLLNVSGVLVNAMGKVTSQIVKLTPLGTFAITASVAGTMTVQAFSRMQIYMIVFIITAIILTFLVIPMVISMFTPFKYRDIMAISKDALITAFMTGNLFILLPMMTDNCKKLFADYGLQDEHSESMPGIIIPIAYNFPNIGKLLAMLFVTFAAWYCGHPLTTAKYPGFLVSGLMSLFGSSTLAVPFLLDMLQLPTDLFELYMTSGIIVGKFATMIALINLFAVAMICTYFMTVPWNKIFNLKRIVTATVVCAIVTGAVIPVTRTILGRTLSPDNSQLEQLMAMKLRNPVEIKMLDKVPTGNPGHENSSLTAIRKRKILRVGYIPNQLPFTYLTANGEPAGFDFAMLNSLCRGMNWKMELIPVEPKNIYDALERGVIDIGAGGLTMSLNSIEEVNFTDSYMDINMALVAKDYEKDIFPAATPFRKMVNMKVAIMRGSRYIPMIKSKLPGVELIELDDYKDFFTKKVEARVLVISAEAGAAWTIIYPEFTVVIPKPVVYRDIVGYAVARDNHLFLTFLNLWLKLMDINGYKQQFYNYWIEGKSDKVQARWSIMNDVLKLSRSTRSVPTEH